MSDFPEKNGGRPRPEVAFLARRERPFDGEDEAELRYELAVRVGPFARCGGCGFLPDYRVDLMAKPQCPRCQRVGTLARWKRWAPAQVMVCPQANDWARRVAEGLGLCWPGNDRKGGGC